MQREQELIARFEKLTRILLRANGRRPAARFDEEQPPSHLHPAQIEREKLMSELVWFRRRRGETLFTIVRQVECGQRPDAAWVRAERERQRRLRRSR